MRIPTKSELEKLRKEFPKGCRIVLDEMDDVQAPKPGAQGTCQGVDDAGNILVNWDGGGSLNVVYGTDICHRVASEEEIRQSLDWFGKRWHGVHVVPGAVHVRKQGTVSWRKATGQTSRYARPAGCWKGLKMRDFWNVCHWRSGGL